MNKTRHKWFVVLVTAILVLSLAVSTEAKTVNSAKFWTQSPSPSPLATYKVFVSSGAYTGNLGGLTGADAKCQSLALAANLTGTYQAWLSDSSNNAKDRIPEVKYVLVDGTTVVADNKADLIDGTILKQINQNEIGTVVSNGHVFTGTKADGTKDTITCSNWTNSNYSQQGRAGSTYYISGYWTEDTGWVAHCNNATRLYCFQVSQDTPPPPTPLPTYKVFVSSGAYTGNLGGIAGADNKCQSLALTAGLEGGYRAWVSTDNINAKDRIPNVKYVLVDGTTVVADNEADLIDGTIDNKINKDENGSSRTVSVWTGTNSDGTKHINTCNNWTGAGSGSRGRLGVTTQINNAWTSQNNISCNVGISLYCFQDTEHYVPPFLTYSQP